MASNVWLAPVKERKGQLYTLDNQPTFEQVAEMNRRCPRPGIVALKLPAAKPR